MRKTKINPVLREDWWLFCSGYLKLAELSCREMIDQKYLMFKHTNREFGPKAFWIYNLYIPTIYNLKHSIEIFLKYFYIILEDKIPEIGRDGHNIEKFLRLFQDNYNLERINKVVREAYQTNKDSRYDLNTAELETQFSEDWLENIAKITLKYFYCEDIKSKIKKFDLVDIVNDGFRYPQNKLRVDLNYTELAHSIDKQDIKTVLADINELRNAFNSLRYLIDVYHDIKKS